MRRSRFLLTAVLALAAALLQASWPLIAGAGPGQQRTMPVAQLCSVSGSPYAPADDDPPVSPSRQYAPHCAYCSLNPGHSVLPSAALALTRGGVQDALVAVPPLSAPVPQQRASMHDGYPRPPPALV